MDRGQGRDQGGDGEVKIELLCYGCKKQVGLKAGDAVVHVHLAEADAYRTARQEWDAAHPADHGWSWEALETLPDRARWAIHCNDCNPHWNEDRTEACAGCYWFDATRADSAERLLAWTAHLMGKRWFRCTRWGDFIRPFSDDA